MLRVGEMGDNPNVAWKNEIEWYSENSHFKELNRIDSIGVRVENIPRIHDAGHPRKDSKINERHTVSLSISTAKSSSCQCSTTLYGEKMQRHNEAMLTKLRIVMLAGSLAVVGHSWDLDQKRNGTRPVQINQTEIGTELQN